MKVRNPRVWQGTGPQFRDYFERWMTNARKVLLEPEVMTHWLAVQAFITWNGGRQSVTHESLQEYVQHVARTEGARKAQAAARSLRMIFQTLGDRSPAQWLRVELGKKASPTKLVAATYDQMNHIRLEWSKDGEEEDRYLLVTLMWECGLSLRDAMTLRWESIDLERGMISGRRVKTDSPYFVPFEVGGELHKILEERLAPGLRKGPVFDRYSVNVPTQRKKVGLQMAPIFRRLGFDRLNGTHCFRRAFITRHVRAGTHPTIIAQMVGHRRLDQIIDYSKNTVDDLKLAVDEARARLATMAGPHKPQGVSYARPPKRKYESTIATRLTRRARGAGGDAPPDVRADQPTRQLGEPAGRSDGEVPAGVRSDDGESSGGDPVLPAVGGEQSAAARTPVKPPGLQQEVSGEAAWVGEDAEGAGPGGPSDLQLDGWVSL